MTLLTRIKELLLPKNWNGEPMSSVRELMLRLLKAA